MDNNQEQSSVGKKTQGAYGKFQNLQAASRLGRLGTRLATQAGSRIATAVAGSTVEVWGPIAIVVGVVVVFTFVIVMTVGSPSSLEADVTTSPTPFQAITPSPTVIQPSTSPTP